MERTLVLIKPDGVKKKLIGKIIDRFEQAGFDIVNIKTIRLSRQLLDNWYSHHKDKPFFNQLCQFMMETPVVVIVLQGNNIVERVRNLCGPTDSRKALKGTIRGDFGEDIQRNIVHASDSPDRAEFEISLLFKPQEFKEV